VQPTIAEAAGPNAFPTKVETPPPPGKRAESWDIVSASGNVRSVIAPQATSEDGPGVEGDALRPSQGRRRLPFCFRDLSHTKTPRISVGRAGSAPRSVLL
jgi:hypothetical protein